MNTNDWPEPSGGAAYPQGTITLLKLGENAKGDGEIKGGLTKRELFAAMAMQGMCSCNLAATSLCDFESMAQYATAAADALLKELAK